MAALWHYHGTPPFLKRQAARLGSTEQLADRARHNPEIYRLSVLLCQLAERYHRARKEDGEPVFGPLEITAIEGIFSMAEQELQKLHMLAGAADAMLEEAYGAFNLNAPARSFVILAESDDGETLPGRTTPIESETSCLSQP